MNDLTITGKLSFTIAQAEELSSDTFLDYISKNPDSTIKEVVFDYCDEEFFYLACDEAMGEAIAEDFEILCDIISAELKDGKIIVEFRAHSSELNFTQAEKMKRLAIFVEALLNNYGYSK